MSVLQAPEPMRAHGTASSPAGSTGSSHGLFRKAVLRRLAKITADRLTIVGEGETLRLGHSDRPGLTGTIAVRDQRFYRSVAFGGGLGAAEAYIRGYWDSEDLTSVMRVLAKNISVLTDVDRGAARLLAPLRLAVHWLRRNTRSGSKRNIAAHYDLSNDFFTLMLDPTMTYSSGIFTSSNSTMEEASVEKYDRICRKLELSPDDHVLEIGTGWGGFAVHAVKHYGCRITTTTISEQQFSYARERFREASLDDRVSALKTDYRDLRGQFDKLVSIEMVEAVGEQFLPIYFAKCCDLLRPCGQMAFQAITIPDHRYDSYRGSVDFIQRYVFPGGFLPSIGAIGDCLRRATDFRFHHCEEFGTHYAKTLDCWRGRFWANIDAVTSLGFDDRFIRTWHYYLCYCEAAFRERQIGVSQIVLTKPACRRQPILASL